jgi:hypothetical protein
MMLPPDEEDADCIVEAGDAAVAFVSVAVATMTFFVGTTVSTVPLLSQMTPVFPFSK